MLELPSLFIKPWLYVDAADWPEAMGPGAGWLRMIANPAGDCILGFAAWDDLAPFSWLAWLGRKKIHVFETEDESLLLTVVRPWGLAAGWEILDAEQQRVGRLFPDSIFDGTGARLASVGMNTDGKEFMLRGDDGKVLGSWLDVPGQGSYFHFAPGWTRTHLPACPCWRAC